MSSLVQQAKENFLNRDFGKSYQLLLKNLKRNPNEPKANFLLGGLCMTTHKFDLAKNYLSKCLEMKPYQKKFIYQMATLYLMTDQYTESKLMFNKYLNINKSNYKVYFNLATIYEQENDYKEAKQNYLKCLQLQPSHEKSRLAIKRLEKKIVQKSEEKELERQALEKELINIEYKCMKIEEEKQKILCKNCKKKISNYASDACGHLILCQQCKDTYHECLICKKTCNFFRVFML